LVIVQRLRPLFESDGEGKDREWTVARVIERLQGICRNRVVMEGIEFDKITEADAEQKEILRLLQTPAEAA
jgi:hypothetical protein